MSMSKRIFQYDDPQAKGDPTRWVAAWNMQRADDIAAKRGWVKEFADNEIFKGKPLSCKTIADFKKAGCDVVLP
jgi:hypothetical protein